MSPALRRGTRATVPARLRSSVEVVVLSASLPLAAFAQETTRVSVDSSGAETDGDNELSVISADGHFVAFWSNATNLVAGDTNGQVDVFVHDRVTGTTDCVSVDPSGVPGGGFSGGYPIWISISADGRFVSFMSDATDLVSGRTTSGNQIFVRDRLTGITELASVDSAGVQGNDTSVNSSLSADGRFVAFDSGSSNLVAGDRNGNYDVFVHDRTTGITERVSVDSVGHQCNLGGESPFISADGRVVAFSSFATNLVPNDKNNLGDVFVHDRQSGATERISVDSSGAEGNGDSWAGSLSADGQVVTLWSWASNLVASDTNGLYDVFVRDRSKGVTERVSLDSSGAEANGDSWDGWISSDGSIVAFGSVASNLVPGDLNATSDAFVRDRSTGITSRVSVDSSGGEANNSSPCVTISADGRVASFFSYATNLVAGDTNGFADVFVRDDRPASWSNYGSGFPGTYGVPSFTSLANPVPGTTVTLDLENSLQLPTVGVVFVGAERASIHSSWGGDLLVSPVLTVPITFSYGHDQFTWSIPIDFYPLGQIIDLQAIEADPGAAKGVSFTPGLELVVGI
jgi:hypothetical protein